MMRFFLVILFFLAHTLFATVTHFPLELLDSGKIRFTVEHTAAQSVSLAGSFNNWNKDELPFQKDEMGVWQTSLELGPGAYEYKIVVDGETWLPESNLSFTVEYKDGKLHLSGGEGFTSDFVHTANLKGNGKISLEGRYSSVLVPAFDGNRNSLLENRHIVQLNPRLKVNEKALLTTSFLVRYPVEVTPFFWKSSLILKAVFLDLQVFNNDNVMIQQDFNRTLGRYTFTSGVGLFDPLFPMTADKKDETKIGLNYRGISGKLKLHFIDAEALYMRPLFDNFDVSAFSAGKVFGPVQLKALLLMERGKYDWNEYPNPDVSGWFSYKDSAGKYQIDSTSFVSEGAAYTLRRLGAEMRIRFSEKSLLSFEFLSKKKEGGFFARTLQSDGYDLPLNFSNDGTKYDKYRSFYEGGFQGSELGVGFRFDPTRRVQAELKMVSDSLVFQEESVKDIKPSSLDLMLTARIRTGKVESSTRMEYIVNDKRANAYDYSVPFDSYEFVGRSLPGCDSYVMFTELFQFRFGPSLKVKSDFTYSGYSMKDIYFGIGKNWYNQTLMAKGVLEMALPKNFSLSCGLRFKSYDLAAFLTEDSYVTYRAFFINPHIGMKWDNGSGFMVYLGAGLVPENDKDLLSGFNYSLNSELDGNWPFFMNAEKSFSERYFITLKSEALF